MQIITDNGIDIAAECLEGLAVHVVPLTITVGDAHYKGGVDIQSEAFYHLLRTSGHFPTTSQPSPADFQAVYTQLAEQDPDIISIHMSAQLSGTYNAARLGAERTMKETPGTHITVIDSRHISGSLGYMVEAAARAAAAGWERQAIVELVEQVGRATTIIFSPDTMRYLVHGGRASHLQGFAASMLNIKPVLRMTHTGGNIESIATVRTMRKALVKQVDIIAGELGEDTPLRVQVEHADNPQMASVLRDLMIQRFDCDFLPDTSITPLVGAHTGPGLVGMTYAARDVFAPVP